ncbi:hypothetical protein [Acinetobacter sp.]|uniref:hypothetical protein n=1 Tax=Acinetobacter sp. TaxID=472 RepID=UPI0031E3C76A
MEKLIVKGGFRERANRNRKYQHSENQQTKLDPHRYSKSVQEHVSVAEQNSNPETFEKKQP